MAKRRTFDRGNPAKHGTVARYAQRLCRCRSCKKANAAYCKWRKEERQRQLDSLPAEAHGKYTTYNNWGCRCDACVDAWADAHLLYDTTGAYV